MVTFSNWLSARSDAQLVIMLSHRMDLTSPSPTTLASLAARATSRASLERATATLDAAHLTVLESVAVLDALGETVTTSRAVAAIGAPANNTSPVPAVLDALLDLALLWQPEPGAVRPAPGIEDALSAYPAGLGPPLRPHHDRPDLALLDSPDAPAGTRAILTALQWGPPIGRLPATADTPTAAPTRWLIAHGFVHRVDPQHVLLPREIAMDLRAGRTHRDLPTAPAVPEPALEQATIDAESARAAQEVVRMVAEVLTTWQTVPAAALKAGGLGVRELRRLAQQLDADEPAAAFVVELALMAALVTGEGTDPVAFAPTVDADAWLAADLPTRWATLAAAWSASARAPWLVGSRDDRGALRGALEPGLHRVWVPRLRSQLLDVLAEAPRAPINADAALATLTWRAPRSAPPLTAVTALLHEAALLGVTGAGALAAGGHLLAATGHLLAMPDDATRLSRAGALADSLAATLPDAVDVLLLQGDLTGIVPGRPTVALEALLTSTADVESRGAAITVRFTPESITRAFGAGRTADDLLTELTAHSKGPVPQPLHYLVHDAARRHGQVRLGAATSYVRVDDPALLAGLVEDPKLAALGLFTLAPTVLAATVPAAQLLTALRARGLAPATEDRTGTIIHTDRTAHIRLPGRRGRQPGQHPRTVDGAGRTDRLQALITDLRAQSALPQGRRAQGQRTQGQRTQGELPTPAGSGVGQGVGTGTADPLIALGLLREAAADGREVWLEAIGPTGNMTRRRVRPVRIDAGRLRAIDIDRAGEITVAVHRIAGVEPVTDS